MEPIYPLTALSKDVKEVKDCAKENVVRITENGKAAYIFTSEKVFEERIRREREDAAYEAYLLKAVGEGIEDVQAGRYVTTREEVFAEASKRRKRHA
ncbi:hypothetical protein [Raoultibacter phocaeensis]|uniref:hypothetical protein n=1 Tax=Raoultibacter phocaeensis TaxID=2479841 RepID=UPI001118F2C1|nr:hypothetical protein [Raoultibacter phocaeensis]